MEDSSPVRTAKNVELDKLAELLEDLSKRFKLRFEAELGFLCGQGQGLSPAVSEAYMQLQCDHGEKLITEGVRFRRDSIARVPALATESELSQWQEVLANHVGGIFSGRYNVPRASPAALARIEQETSSNKERAITTLQRRMRILGAETSLPGTTYPGNIHIHAGAGSIVTVGSIADSTLSVLNHMSSENAELVSLLTQLIQEIRVSREIGDQERLKALESLEFIARQVSAKPEDRVNTTVLETIWNALPELISTASNLVTIYGAAAPFIERVFS